MRPTTRRSLALWTSFMTLACTPALAEIWRLETGYDLPRRAAVKAPTAYEGPILQAALPIGPRLFGTAASHSQILSADAVTGDYTAELWLMDHVNQPIGAVMSVGNSRLGYYNGTAVFGPEEAMQSANLDDKAFKERWHHLVLVREGQRLSLYHNGVKLSETTGTTVAGSVRLDSYLGHEPYMIPANLVHTAALERRALSASEIAARFNAQSQLVEEGRLYADRFHFTQPPYLNTPQTDSIELSFEFDHDATAQVAYGETEDTLKTVALPGSSRLHGLKLGGLKPDTPYFYRVTGTDAKGQKLDSGLLSFRSAPLPGRPFVMVISGDTEARPHINNRMVGRTSGPAGDHGRSDRWRLKREAL
jgi:acid phosphatase type 7